MNLYIVNHNYHYEMENLLRVFFPNEKIEKIYEKIPEGEFFVYTKIEDKIEVRVHKESFDKTIEMQIKEDNELEMAVVLYDLLCELTQESQPWGILTGIRPIKLFDNIQKEIGEENAVSLFRDKYRVSKEKLQLTLDVYNIEKEIKSLSRKNSFSLYVSIPFCPSRCNYCSFISSSISKTKHLVDRYIPLLCEEIEYTAKISNELKLRLESVYIGGGTPTTLSAYQLDLIIKKIQNCFDMSFCKEFTVEAGRPDTITEEKMYILKENKVSRISINPQTLSDNVLESIGRKHTVDDIFKAYDIARKVGIDNINMDVIAGLTDDNFEGFKHTIDGIIDLNPESITVHTLALKSGSNLYMQGNGVKENYSTMIKNMVDYSYEKLTHNKYVPYYLYRQSKMIGNLENVGYSKKGFESYYNIYVMEETHSILACGAGAVTKLRDPDSNNLERVFNFKYPFEYIDRFNEMIERKQNIIEFYNNL